MDLGEVIYTTMKPQFKIYFTISVGFILSKNKILTVDTCKNLINVAIKVLIPALAFDKIVSNINNTYVYEISTIVVVSCFMQVCGGLMCFITGYIISAPRIWWGGLISVGILSNISDLPIAYLNGFSGSEVFGDVDIGTSYVIIFMVLQMISQFNLGLYKLIEMDFLKEMKLKEENNKDTCTIVIPKNRAEGESIIEEHINIKSKQKHEMMNKIKSIKFKRVFKSLLVLWKESFIQPSSIVVIISITISMIPWLQALFTTSKQTTIHSAPDGQPPLSFILDFASYLGASQVPFGLMLLGATMNRIDLKKVDKTIWKVPLVVSILKLMVFPIIGCAFNSGLKKAGLFYGEDILHFICNVNFGLPAATSNIYVTSMYLPDDDESHIQMDILAMMYIFQYVLLVVSLPFLATYSIKVSLQL